MIILSYNLSDTLANSLKKIERQRSQVLLTPVSPRLMHQLSWAATLAHLSGWAHISNQPLSEDTLAKLLTGPGDNRTSTPFVKKALNYRQALNHIWLDWTANPRPVTTADFKRLAGLLDVSFRHEDEVTSLLGYIQTGNVHPIIQSAIVHMYFYPSRMAYLSSLLILYKYGYDFRQLITLEDYWSAHKDSYLQVLQSATKLGQITLWLEYYCSAVISQLENLLKNLTRPPAISQPPAFWELTDRQKTLLALADPPNTLLTNRRIQAELKISQITASRDLAKLTALNLLIPHGHGRSTTYTQA